MTNTKGPGTSNRQAEDSTTIKSRSAKFLALKRVANTAGITYLGMALSIVSAPLVARELGPEGRGELAGAFVLVQLMAWLSFLGIPRGLSVQVGRVQKSARTGVLLLTLLGVASTVITLALADWVSNGSAEVALGIRIASVVLLGTGIAQYGGDVLLATGRLLPWNLMRLATAGLPSVCFIAAFALGQLTIEVAFMATLAGQVISTVIGCVFALKYHRSDREMKVPWTFSLKYWSASAFDSLGGRLDQIFLAALTPISNLGVYAVAVTCAAASGAMAQALNHTGFAGFISSAADTGTTSVKRKTILGTLVSLASGIAVVVALALFQESLLGPGYEALIPTTALLIVAQITADQWQLRIYLDSAMEDASGLWRSSAAALLILLLGVAVLSLISGLNMVSMAIVMIIFGAVRLVARHYFRRAH